MGGAAGIPLIKRLWPLAVRHPEPRGGNGGYILGSRVGGSHSIRRRTECGAGGGTCAPGHGPEVVVVIHTDGSGLSYPPLNDDL